MDVYLLIIAVSAVFWLVLTLSIRTGILLSLDKWLLATWHKSAISGEPHTARRLDTVMRDLTALGGDALASLALATGIIILLSQGRNDAALNFSAIVIVSRIAGIAMKAVIKRPHPNLAASHIQIFTSSFPSAYTLMAFSLTFAVIFAPGQSLSRTGSRRADLDPCWWNKPLFCRSLAKRYTGRMAIGSHPLQFDSAFPPFGINDAHLA